MPTVLRKEKKRINDDGGWNEKWGKKRRFKEIPELILFKLHKWLNLNWYQWYLIIINCSKLTLHLMETLKQLNHNQFIMQRTVELRYYISKQFPVPKNWWPCFHCWIATAKFNRILLALWNSKSPKLNELTNNRRIANSMHQSNTPAQKRY
jgi:hypothetical protein